ncbi:MAG: sulfite exporter TauE/SafE family protein [Planctomycetota bacterium]
MSELTVAVLVVSFLGSPHCAGMCGPFMMFALGTGSGTTSRQQWINHTAYHGARLFVYLVLGAIAGAVGAALDLGGSWFGLQRTATILAGAAMITFGLIACGRYLGLRIPYWGLPSFVQKGLAAGNRYAAKLGPTRRAATVGLLTTFMPCGWLYAFLFAAAGTGAIWGGLLTMTFFWLGTVPVLLALGVGVQRLTGPIQAKLPLVTAVFIVLVGVYAVTHRASADLKSWSESRETVTNNAEAVDSVRALEDEQLPCCHPKTAGN